MRAVKGQRIQRRMWTVFLLLVVGAILPALLLLDRWLAQDVHHMAVDALATEATALANELERTPPADLQAWAEGLARLGQPRLTVIGLDGQVLADSALARQDLPHMENHAARPEVVTARAGRVGEAMRHSRTTQQDMVYVAVPVGAGSPPKMVLRLAIGLEQEGHEAIADVHEALWLTFLISACLALLVGTVFARWMSRPVLAMIRAARAMANGDFSASLPAPTDDELGDLVLALETLRNQLASRIEELRIEGVKLRTILNGMAEGVALVQRGQITVANPAFEKLLGVAGVEGRRPLEAARLPELADIIVTAVTERKEGQREAQLSGRTLLLQAHPLGTPASEQAVVVALDISETRRLERLRREFVANASHELRTPVAAILGVAETLTGGAAEDPLARDSFLDILQRHAQRLSRLTADLLDIARLEAGYKPRAEPVVVHEAVDTVLSALRTRAEEKQLTLAMEVPTGLKVIAERAAVDQILTNFVDNAVKYTPAGGRVTVRAGARGSGVQIAVEDTGPGIPHEHLPRLFERFYRVDDARSRELGGTGLGLAIVKHLVLANGGDVKVESIVGRGTTFTVTLPRG